MKVKELTQRLLILILVSVLIFSCEKEFGDEVATNDDINKIVRKDVPAKDHGRSVIETGSYRYDGPVRNFKTTGGNKLGIWLWYLDGTGYSSHTALAADLAAMGVKRVYVKVADGSYDADEWPEVNDETVPQAYQNAGLECWAWAYNYPGNEYAQADALYYAAAAGYEGFVTDIEIEFDGKTTELHDFLSELVTARQDAINYGHCTDDFKIYCTSWGNPGDHGMRVDIIDQYVDAHMPQTYVEVWGQSYMDNAGYWVDQGTQEYQDLGCVKPVHHIVSAEHNEITAAQIDDFIEHSGIETSVWRIPGGGTSLDIWDDLEQVNWNYGEVSETVTVSSVDVFSVGVTETISGTASSGVDYVKVYLDQYEIANETVSNGTYSFDIAFNTAGQNRNLVAKGYNSGNVQVAEASKYVDVVEGASEEVTISVPAEITVGQSAHFSGTATAGISHVIISVDGWEIANEPVTNGTYQFDYTFNGAGQDRHLVANAFNSNGESLAQDDAYIDVNEDAQYIAGVPYFYQYNNSINPGGSCQNTSMAMVLKYYGASSETPDEISGYYGTSQGQTVSGWQTVFNSEAAYFGLNVRDAGTETGSVSQVRQLLAEGKPVVVHGYFTSYGHVITLVGFDGTYYYAHDPAGKWSEVYGYGGYSGTNQTEGKYVMYHKDNVDAAMAPDGNVWMHEIYTVN